MERQEIKMVLKCCAWCRQYFEGIFDGQYACPNCRAGMHASSPEPRVEVPVFQRKAA